jgi:DNA replication protein DnaC
MNTIQTLQELRQLKLTGMAASYQAQLELPLHQQLESHELIAELTQAEILEQSNDRAAYYLKLAKLRLNALPENIDCSPGRNLTKQQLHLLLQSLYIKQGEPILITGSTGSGKSFLACALAHQACTQGYRTLYFNMNRFIEKIAQARLDGSYLKLLDHMERTPLIVLDDFGLQSLDQQLKITLLQILEDRYAKKSIIIVSQLPVAKWHEFLNEPTIADAIMDRITAKAHRIELKGDSLRNKKHDK